jgi:hypothetical protein
MKRYVLNVLVGFDQWLNTFRGAPPGVTISSSAALARWEGKWWGCQLCRFLEWLEPDHCSQAQVNDARRAREAAKEVSRDETE